MKFFLSSLAPSDELASSFLELVGKKPQAIQVALIENAADVEEGWINQIRPALQKMGVVISLVDLREYRSNSAGLKSKLANADVIWIGGGNTFYLRWLLQETGADTLIRAAVKAGAVYGGDSAGAVVIGPTLQYFDAADDPKAAPHVQLNGLNLIGTVVVPHADNPKLAVTVKNIQNELRAAGYATQPLGDAQALIINGNDKKVV